MYVIQELRTPLFDQFLNGLQEDKFGNIQYQSESGHLITLHYSARSVQRSGNDDKLTSICSDLNAVKKKMIINLQDVATQSLILLNLLQHLTLVTGVKRMYELSM